MKRIVFHLIILIFIFISCQPKNSKSLVIATSANMQFTIPILVKAFTKQTGIKCETIISSSGKLTAQIMEGAPFDIFVSADMKYPEELHKNGFTTSKPKIYASGHLVLWSMENDVEVSVNSLTKNTIKHIAIANPKTAPYGKAAIEVLKHYDILERVQHKLVYGESISQVNQFISSEAAEVGFTSKSIVINTMHSEGKWLEINSNLHSTINQGLVIIKNENNHSKEALQFYDFMFSTKGKEILNKFGYSVPE